MDASALIDLIRHYPPDIFKGLWREMERLVKEERLIIPEEVWKEVSKRSDELTEWIKSHKNSN